MEKTKIPLVEVDLETAEKCFAEKNLCFHIQNNSAAWKVVCDAFWVLTAEIVSGIAAKVQCAKFFKMQNGKCFEVK